jgi:hypothetical protein
MKELIVKQEPIPGLPADFTLAEFSIERQSALVEEARQIVSVSDADQQIEAATMGSKLKGVIKDAATTRLEWSRPLDDSKKRLMNAEREFCRPLEREIYRLGVLVNEFQRRERERVQAEERRRQEEFRRLSDERAKAEAEAAKATTPIERIQAQQAAFLAEEQARAVITAPPVEAAKARGTRTVKEELCFEVLDIDLLWKEHPELCNPPTARPSAIKSVCHPDRPVPGLRLWFESRTSFTSR